VVSWLLSDWAADQAGPPDRPDSAQSGSTYLRTKCPGGDVHLLRTLPRRVVGEAARKHDQSTEVAVAIMQGKYQMPSRTCEESGSFCDRMSRCKPDRRSGGMGFGIGPGIVMLRSWDNGHWRSNPPRSGVDRRARLTDTWFPILGDVVQQANDLAVGAPL
jgi:hypothetical protein